MAGPGGHRRRLLHHPLAGVLAPHVRSTCGTSSRHGAERDRGRAGVRRRVDHTGAESRSNGVELGARGVPGDARGAGRARAGRREGEPPRGPPHRAVHLEPRAHGVRGQLHRDVGDGGAGEGGGQAAGQGDGPGSAADSWRGGELRRRGAGLGVRDGHAVPCRQSPAVLAAEARHRRAASPGLRDWTRAGECDRTSHVCGARPEREFSSFRQRLPVHERAVGSAHSALAVSRSRAALVRSSSSPLETRPVGPVEFSGRCDRRLHVGPGHGDGAQTRIRGGQRRPRKRTLALQSGGGESVRGAREHLWAGASSS